MHTDTEINGMQLAAPDGARTAYFVVGLTGFLASYWSQSQSLFLCNEIPVRVVKIAPLVLILRVYVTVLHEIALTFYVNDFCLRDLQILCVPSF